MIGRDISTVIIIDNVQENFKMNPDNGILIKSWFDDDEDNALEQLTPLLLEIGRKAKDVRTALQSLRK